jgi:2-methylcitrate dehydratase PrpD
MNITEKIATFLHTVKFEDLPDTVVQKTKLHFLDFVGVSLDGFRKGTHKLALTVCGSSDRESSVIGQSTKRSCVDASFLNSMMAGLSNFEDGHRFASGHPAAVVTPAALATAERQGSSGKVFLLSLVLGYEVFCRVARSINPSHLARGFHSTASVGPLGSAGAVSKIFALDYEQVCRALDMAAVFSGAGFLEALTTELRYFQVARSCQAGVIAAMLAREPILSSRTILDGARGFCRAVSDEYDVKAIVEDLGSRFEIMDAYLKIHGGCRHLAAPMDAVRQILAENQLSPSHIDRIVIKTYPVAMEYEIDNPKTGTEAEFSIPFGVSVGMLENFAGPDVFSDSKINDPKVRELMKRVSVEIDESLAKAYPRKRGVIAEVYTRGGSYRCELDIAKGDPEFPATETDIKTKFEFLTSYCFGRDKMQRVMDKIMNLDTLASLDPIVSELTSLSKE